MGKVIWNSIVTDEMTKGMSGDELELLVADLSDAVQAVCEEWGLDGK